MGCKEGGDFCNSLKKKKKNRKSLQCRIHQTPKSKPSLNLAFSLYFHKYLSLFSHFKTTNKKKPRKKNSHSKAIPIHIKKGKKDHKKQEPIIITTVIKERKTRIWRVWWRREHRVHWCEESHLPTPGRLGESKKRREESGGEWSSTSCGGGGGRGWGGGGRGGASSRWGR